MVGNGGPTLVKERGLKAGMEGLDERTINRVIEEASKGTKYYAKKQADQARTQEQVVELTSAASRLSDQELDSARASADVLIERMRNRRRLDKVIVHIDMDMFYAAVEMRDQPKLQEKPMAVGTIQMLSTSNYKARKYGVRSAMPGFIARKLCPHLVLVPPNMVKYAAEARRVRKILAEYDENFLPVSLDEAYLDITALVEKQMMASRSSHSSGEEASTCQGQEMEVKSVEEVAASIVSELRKKIEVETKLTASAGIACNKRLAKVASDMEKPNGQLVVGFREESVVQFAQKLNVRKIGGIGSVQEQLLNAIGVNTCGDLYEKRAEVKLLFSNLNFEFYMEASQGFGETSLQPLEEREVKSIGVEKTFKETTDRERLLVICQNLSKELANELKEKNMMGSAVTVVIKTNNFKQTTRVGNLLLPSGDEVAIFDNAKWSLTHLLDKNSKGQTASLRMMGLRMTKLKENPEQRVDNFSKMESEGVKSPADGSGGDLDRLRDAKSKLVDKLNERKSHLGDCPDLFTAKLKAVRGEKAEGWESSSQSQEEVVMKERIQKPPVSKTQGKKVRRNLFGKQHSFQNARVQQEIQQKKRELGDHQRRLEKSKSSLTEDSQESQGKVSQAPGVDKSTKPDVEPKSFPVVFPSSPTKSVRHSQVSSWVSSACQALPSITLAKRSPQERFLRASRKHDAGKGTEVSKWVAYQRVKAGRRPAGGFQQSKTGRGGRRSRRLKEGGKSTFNVLKEPQQSSFFDSVGTKKSRTEGPLDFLSANGSYNEEPRVTEILGGTSSGWMDFEQQVPDMWKGQTGQSSVQGMFKGVPDVVGGEDFAAGQGWNLQGDSWRGGGGDWSEQIDRGFDQGIDRGFDQEKNIYLPYDHPAGLVDSQWNSSGHPDLRPRTRRNRQGTRPLGRENRNGSRHDMVSLPFFNERAPFGSTNSTFMEMEDGYDASALKPLFMW